MTNYIAVNIRKDFAKQIDLIKEIHQFHSRADVIRYCVRKEFAELERKTNELE